MKKYGKSGRPGRRRRNMPGYYLGINKIGRKSWFASRRPQDIDAVRSKKDFIDGKVEVGSVFALSKTSNAIFLGTHQGRILYYNPKTDRVGHTGFGRLGQERSVAVLKDKVGLDYFKSENDWMNHRKIPGSDLRVSDVLTNPYRKTIAKKVGDQFTMLDYHKSAVVGDVLRGNDSNLTAEVVAITKKGMVVKVDDGTPNGKIGHINLKNSAFRDRQYTMEKSALKNDLTVENLQDKFKKDSYRSVETAGDGVIMVKKREVYDGYNKDKFKNETRTSDSYSDIGRVAQTIHRVFNPYDYINNESGRSEQKNRSVLTNDGDKPTKQGGANTTSRNKNTLTNNDPKPKQQGSENVTNGRIRTRQWYDVFEENRERRARGAGAKRFHNLPENERYDAFKSLPRSERDKYVQEMDALIDRISKVREQNQPLSLKTMEKLNNWEKEYKTFDITNSKGARLYGDGGLSWDRHINKILAIDPDALREAVDKLEADLGKKSNFITIKPENLLRYTKTGDVIQSNKNGLSGEILTKSEKGAVVKIDDGTPEGEIGHINFENLKKKDPDASYLKTEEKSKEPTTKELQKKLNSGDNEVFQIEGGGNVVARRGRPAGSTNRPLTEEQKNFFNEKAKQQIEGLDNFDHSELRWDESSNETLQKKLGIVKKIISYSNNSGDTETNKKYKKIRQNLLYKKTLSEKYDQAQAPEEKLDAAKAALKYEERVGGEQAVKDIWSRRIKELGGEQTSKKKIESQDNFDNKKEAKEVDELTVSKGAPDKRLKGYTKLSESDRRAKEPGEKFFAYDLHQNKIIEVTVEATNKYGLTIKKYLTPLIKNGKAEKDIDISVEIGGPSKQFIALEKSPDPDYHPKKSHSLLQGDFVYVKDKGLCRVDGGGEDLIQLEGSLTTLPISIKDLNDDDFEVIKSPASPTSPIAILRNLLGQTHLVIHREDGNLPLKISEYKIDFDKNKKKLGISLNLTDSQGRLHEISTDGDELLKNNLFDASGSISSIRLNYENVQTYTPPSTTPMERLKKYGIEKAAAHLSIPGCKNNISIRVSNETIAYENDLSINGADSGEITRSISPGDSNDWKFYNSFFEIPPSLQGDKIAQRFYDNQAKLGKFLNVKYLEMQCAMSVGGYAWATKSKGFDFIDSQQAEKVKNDIIADVSDMTLDDWRLFHATATQEVMQKQKKAIISELNKKKLDSNGNLTYQFYYDTAKAHEFAEFSHSYLDENGNKITVGRKRESKTTKDKDNRLHHLGKASMLGSSWYGIKRLDDAKHSGPEWEISTIEAKEPEPYKTEKAAK